MLLALVFTVQAATAQTANASPAPCADQMSMLCRISPYFCPGAYPENVAPGSANVPCWPEKGGVSVSRDTRVVIRHSVEQAPASRKPASSHVSDEAIQRGASRSIVRMPDPR